MTEHENDHEKIQQIKEAMRAAAMSSGLTNEKLEQAMIEGKGRYQTERQEQKAQRILVFSMRLILKAKSRLL